MADQSTHSANQKRQRKGSVVTVLDVGSTKTVCIIARMVPDTSATYLHGRTHAAEVIGLGHTRSVGIKSGVVIDLERAERSIRVAVEAAERMAGLTVDSMIVNMTAGRLRSRIIGASIPLDESRPISKSDLDKVLKSAVSRGSRTDRQVLHLLPVDHVLDGQAGIADPRGMVGSELQLNMHALTADTAPMRNLELAINRAHLSVETMVATPYAAGLSALVDDELELGCACVDMGGGTTSISVFSERQFIHADAIPVGGQHVTMDIARGFSCSIDDAERLKVMHGSVLAANCDDRDTIQVPAIGSDGSDQALSVPRGVLNRIISARVEETLEMLRERINASGHSSVVGKRVVLTGGAAQMSGLAEMARRILGRNVRIGRPLGVRGMPMSAKGPGFSAAVGLMIYPQVADRDQSTAKFMGARHRRSTGTDGPLGRMSQWLRESF